MVCCLVCESVHVRIFLNEFLICRSVFFNVLFFCRSTFTPKSSKMWPKSFVTWQLKQDCSRLRQLNPLDLDIYEDPCQIALSLTDTSIIGLDHGNLFSSFCIILLTNKPTTDTAENNRNLTWQNPGLADLLLHPEARTVSLDGPGDCVLSLPQGPSDSPCPIWSAVSITLFWHYTHDANLNFAAYNSVDATCLPVTIWCIYVVCLLCSQFVKALRDMNKFHFLSHFSFFIVRMKVKTLVLR